jgi:hypothetical protein
MACSICHGEDHNRSHCPLRPEAASWRIGQSDAQAHQAWRDLENFRASVAWWERHRRLRLGLDFAGLVMGIWFGAWVARATTHPASAGPIVVPSCPDCPVCSAAPSAPKVPGRSWKPRAVDAGATDAGWIEPLSPGDAGLPPRKLIVDP